MYIQQLYTGCLSAAAYYIESNGEAAVVDPLRDIDSYLELAKERKTQIKYIFETHFHADFVSGHLDLAKDTGATIVYGPGTKTKFKVHVATDGETFTLGKLTLKALHTPGHTLESTCYLLKDESGADYCVFTGDTLFVGDVGRPDLAQKDTGNTAEELAAMLYDSLHQKLIPLADAVLMYPAHGAGSACGKNLGPQTYSTMGAEKSSNYALQAPDKATFVKSVTEGLQAPPAYFPINAEINKQGYESISAITENGMQPLSIAALKEAVDAGAILVDTRPATQFVNGFVPGSIFIGLEGRFAEWAGSLLPFNKPLILITEDGAVEETIVRLARVGFSNLAGHLAGGYEAWKASGEEIDLVIEVEADELAMDIPFDENLLVADVRRPTEFADGHIKDARNLPLNELTDPATMADIEDEQNVYVHCAGGYRSLIAVSLLKRQGIHNVRNVMGGWAEIQKQKSIATAKEKSVLN